MTHRSIFSLFSLFLALSFAHTLSACGGSDGPSTPDIPTTPVTPVTPPAKVTEKPRYMWIDAPANFYRFANSKDNIREDLKKAKDAGITNIVVDVRPYTGDVLFNSSTADAVTQLDYWDGPSYK